MEYILVIDVGTSRIRGTICGHTGEIVSRRQMEYSPASDGRGGVEQDVGDFLKRLDILLDLTGMDCAAKHIHLCAIAVTSQRSSVIPVDREGEPLGPAIMWLDRRSDSICREINKSIDIYPICGMTARPVYSGPKILWLKRNLPELYEQAFKLIGFHELVLHRLTGNFVTDTSVASRSALLDIHTLKWSPELMKLFGVTEDRICDLIGPGTVAGTLSRRAEAHLRCGEVPVISAGGDQQCAALGMGLLKQGILCVNLGTGAYTTRLCDRVILDPARQTVCNGSAVPGMWLQETSSKASGMVYDWLKRQFFESCTMEEMNDYAAQAGIGAHELLMLPYLLGSGQENAGAVAEGAFLNIGVHTIKGDFARAALEALAGEIWECLQNQRRFEGVTDRLVCAGGLSHSKLYNQILADTCNVPLEVQRQNEATTVGAFMSAAVTLGLQPDLRAAWCSICGGTDLYVPDRERHKRYMEIHRRRRELFLAISKPERRGET